MISFANAEISSAETKPSSQSLDGETEKKRLTLVADGEFEPCSSLSDQNR
jgi:hypothetical protein